MCHGYQYLLARARSMCQWTSKCHGKENWQWKEWPVEWGLTPFSLPSLACFFWYSKQQDLGHLMPCFVWETHPIFANIFLYFTIFCLAHVHPNLAPACHSSPRCFPLHCWLQPQLGLQTWDWKIENVEVSPKSTIFSVVSKCWLQYTVGNPDCITCQKWVFVNCKTRLLYSFPSQFSYKQEP